MTTTTIPKLFVHEEFDDDNNSLGWVLSNGNHPRDIEVVPKDAEKAGPRVEVPPWLKSGR